MRKLHRSAFSTRSTRRGAFTPLIMVGVLVTIVIALAAGGVAFLLPRLASHAAGAVNGDCTLIVPANPLSAKGLATPYQLVATNPNNGPCNEANPNQSAFVQAATIDTATGTISVYNPLVIDMGTNPAVAPVVPNLAATSVVGIWFGFNGNNLTLVDSNGSLQQGNCVNGIDGSIFGQFAYCNAPAFFNAANNAIAAGNLVPPPIGMAKDGLPCPTVRDFGVVDQDQSDNVTTSYLVTANGQTAQATAANMNALQNQQMLTNASDNRLLAIALDGALGCTPWMAPDLANPGQMATALPLDELQAAAHQANPIALVPARDPMVLANNMRNLNKINAYRVGVDQSPAKNLGGANTALYCTHLRAIGPQRIQLDANFTKAAASPVPAVGNSLFTFLAQRFVTSYGPNGLNCMNLLGQPDPVQVTTDANGVAIAATINGTNTGKGQGQGQDQGQGQGMAPGCSVNGKVLEGCAGTTTINGQACNFSFDKQAKQVNITCNAAAG
jgi:hypothetical protein